MPRLDKLEQAGFSVKAVIADQGSNNRRALHTLLTVTEEQPFFIHGQKKVFVLYDPPHLLKNMRNNLKKSGFVDDGALVSWSHIEAFFHFDKQNAVRIAPRLTEKHLTLPHFSKMSVRLAAQTLSHSVAAGISMLVQLGALPEEAKATASFIERIDRLFNAFNSSSLA